MIASYVWRDLVRNPSRSLATLAGIALGVGLFSAVLVFIDGSSASRPEGAGAAAARVSPAALGLHATFPSRELVTPVQANAPGPAGLPELTRRIAEAPGVATADQLSFVDLGPGALRSGSRRAAGAVRVFG